MLNAEKEAAVKKFTEQRGLVLQAGLVEIVGRTPDIMIDEGFRLGSYKSAITLYKAGLYRQGVSPNIILEGARKLSENLNSTTPAPESKKTKKGKKDVFNPTQTSLRAVSGIAESISSEDPAKNPVNPPVTSRRLRKGIEELLRQRPG